MTIRTGVKSTKRPLATAAVAGLAGLSLYGVAQAATATDAAETVALEQRGPGGRDHDGRDHDGRGPDGRGPDGRDRDGRRDDDRGNEVSAVDVTGEDPAIQNVKVTAQPLNNPQTVTVVSKGVMEAQNLLSLRDVLQTVPGITFGAGEGGGGFGDSINLRGFSANNDITQDGVRDSAQYSRSDVFNTEQIEVTNGANSVYSGAGSVGGTINLSAKRPSLRNSTILSAGVGTDNYYRGTIDANHRLSDSVAVRLNAMIHRNDAPGRDVEKFERWGFAPSITVGLDGPTQFTAQYLHQEDTNTPQYGVPYYNGAALPGIDRSAYFGYGNMDSQEQQVDMFTGIIDHNFGDGLTVRNLSRYQEVTQDLVVNPPQGTFCLASGFKPAAWSQSRNAQGQIITNTAGFAACVPGADPAPGFYVPSGPRGTARYTTNTLLYNQTDFSWNGELGGVRHTAVFGFAFLSEDFKLKNGNVQRAANGATPTYPSMSIANPDTTYTGPVNFIQAGASRGTRRNQAVYFFDNAELSSQFSLNVGIRFEHNDGDNQSDTFVTAVGPTLGQVTAGPSFGSDEQLLTYRLGAVYKPVQNASIYVAYGNSKTPSQATVNGAGACSSVTCTVKPETAENFEIGAKYDWNSLLSLTASVFRNNRSNYRVPSIDPTVVPQQLNGSARVDGVALGIAGKITPEWSVFTNYTYLKSKVLQGVNDTFAGQGLDFTKGDAIANVPDHAFSFFTTYDLPNNVQVGYNVTYQGEFYLTQHGTVTGTGTGGIPAVRTTLPLVTTKPYWVHGVTVAWSPTRQLGIRLNIANIFDRTYYARVRNNGWATPGDGRNARLTLTYRM